MQLDTTVARWSSAYTPVGQLAPAAHSPELLSAAHSCTKRGLEGEEKLRETGVCVCTSHTHPHRHTPSLSLSPFCSHLFVPSPLAWVISLLQPAQLELFLKDALLRVTRRHCFAKINLLHVKLEGGRDAQRSSCEDQSIKTQAATHRHIQAHRHTHTGTQAHTDTQTQRNATASKQQ